MVSTTERIRIHYHRPPDRVDLFDQELIERAEGCVVTLLRHASVRRPLAIDGRVVLEPGAPIVWFTFPGAWHDIGRFHTAHGRFTGLYANVLTPVRFVTGNEWETTDLFLDVWLDPTEDARVLDEDELTRAEVEGWVEPAMAARARAEAAALTTAYAQGRWPPAIVYEWTLARALVRDLPPEGTPAPHPV